MSTERQSREVTARTVDEAIQVGLSELGVGLDEVEVDVLERGRPGILGIGVGKARIRLTVRGKEDGAGVAREILLQLLQRLDVEADVFISAGEGEGYLALDVRGEDAGILIGRQGRSLADLQVLLNALVSRRLNQRTPVIVDIEEYKKRRFERVRRLAQRTADRVRRTGRPATLEPMTAAERRVVHMTLSGDSAVTTQSEGVGADRRVTIHPQSPE